MIDLHCRAHFSLDGYFQYRPRTKYNSGRRDHDVDIHLSVARMFTILVFFILQDIHIPGFYDLAHVAKWEVYDLDGPALVYQVGCLQCRSCTVYNGS